MKERLSDRRNWLRLGIVLGVAAVLLFIDQVTKSLVLAHLKTGPALTVIPGLLEFTYVENTGAAFGLLKENLWVVYLVSAVAYLAILGAALLYRSHRWYTVAACAMLLAGGIGNLIDRSQYGFVVDFIHALFFDYVFNFADCCITVACGLLVLHVILLSLQERREEKAKQEQSAHE